MRFIKDRPFIALTLAYIVILIVFDRTSLLKPKTLLPDYSAYESPSEFTGTVTGIPEEKNGKLRFEAKISAADGVPFKFNPNFATAKFGFKALVSCTSLLSDVSPGDNVTLTGNLNAIEQNTNPGNFNYANYLSRKGIHSILYASSMAVTAIHPWNLRTIAFRIRQSALDAIRSRLPQQEADILAPMIVGEQSGLDEEQKQAFQKAGVTHILVVSGLNVAYCAVLFLWGFRALGFAQRKAALLSMPFIVLYVFVTGANPPVIRAGVMALFVILSLSLNREPLIYQSLALAAAVILVFDPQSLFSASFQLSFAATLGIVYLYKYFYSPFEKLSGWLRTSVGSVFAVSLAAQLSVMPLIAYYFNKVSLAGLISNIVIVPLAGLITGTGLMLYLASFISGALANVLAFVNLWLVRILMFCVNAFAALPHASINVPTPSTVFLAMYYFCLWGVFRIKKYPKITWALAGALSTALVVSGLGNLEEKSRVEMTVFSLRHGDSVYINFNGRENWLVDGGGAYTQNSDPGERIIAPFLISRGITKIDKMVISHPHYAHYEGLRYIMENFRVSEIITCPKMAYDKPFLSLMELVKQKNIPWHEAWAGDSFAVGNSTVNVLSPSVILPGTDDNCLVLSVNSYGKRVLLTGDMGIEAEKRIVFNEGLKCEALLLPQHGTRPLTEEFLKESAPEYCVVSTGKKDFQAEGTNCGKQLLSTSRAGALRIIMNAKEISVKPAL